MQASVSNPPVPKRSVSALTALCHAAFVPTGVVTTLLGPLLPLLSLQWRLTDTQAGYLFTSQFLGSLVGVVLSGLLSSLWGFQPTLVAGLFMMSAGTAALVTSWKVGVISIFAYGLGTGFTIPAANLAVAAANPTRRASALNLLNFSWGAGAMASAFLVSVFERNSIILWLLYSLATFLLILAIAVGMVTMPRIAADAGPPPVRERANDRRSLSLFGMALIFFLYVGAENSIAGWVGSYAKRVTLISEALSALTPAFFWGALLLGRGAAPILLARLSELWMARIDLIVASTGVALLMYSRTAAEIIGSTALTGLGLSAVYPITIAALSRKFGSKAALAGSLTFCMSSLGGACLPLLVGYTSSHSSGLRAGLLVPLIACVSMLGIYILGLSA
jgi:FHS family glucose/mannose:H+ symporter-like MFS transporter